MEEDLQPRRDEVFGISRPAVQCMPAFGADSADGAPKTEGCPFPEQYFIASDDESETEWLERDGPARYCIGVDSDAGDCGDPVFEQESLGQSDWRCVERGPNVSDTSESLTERSSAAE
eukprot:2844378-Alexandrium_andersonii.AAC.1